MLEIEIEIAPLISKFDALEKQINDLKHPQMPDELMAWQTEDMRRRYPEIEEPAIGVAETDIFPRSRIPSRTRQLRHINPIDRPVNPRRIVARPTRTPSTRPILRQELFDKLVERMTALLQKALQWPSQA